MNNKIYIIALLALLGIILTIVRESGMKSGDSFSLIQSSKQPITGERVYRMADSTLPSLGIKKENIRPVKNRNDVRVFMPPMFDPISFVKAMKDFLLSHQSHGQTNQELFFLNL